MPQVREIYAVHAGNPRDRVTFEEEVPSLDEMLKRRATVVDVLGLPFIVAVATDSDQVVGYAYLSTFRPRAAYRHTAEVSIYVREGWHGKGVGRGLMAGLIERSGRLHSLVSVMGTQEDNPASYGLHAKFGFRVVGTLRECGFKHGEWIDRLLMEKILPAPSQPAADDDAQ